MKKQQNLCIIGMFLAMVFGFTAVSLLKPDTDFSEKENRMLAKMPELTVKDVLNGTFSREYETYLTDQFFLRDEWIGVKTDVERLMLKQEINDIYFAKDGYLIEKHSGSFDSPTALQNISTLAEFLEVQQAAFGADHVKAMIVPNAVEILKEKLPPFAKNTQEEEFLVRVQEGLPEDSFIDAGNILTAHTNEQLYYRTDHHWTTAAARHVYKVWAEKIGLSIVPDEGYTQEILTDEFYGTIEAKVNTKVQADTLTAWKPLKPVPYTVILNRDETNVKESLYDLSYLDTRDKYAVYFGGNQPLIEIDTEAESNRRLLVIKDSYAHCFVPFAVQDFAAVTMIDLRYFNESLSEYMHANEFTDVLVLYNASGFAEDTSIGKLLH
ncbi:MAG: DHHW family protein [Marvinbryantia sp.]|jgi:hypothetical protein